MRVFCLYMYVHAEQCLVSRLFFPPKSGFSPVRGFATGVFLGGGVGASLQNKVLVSPCSVSCLGVVCG